LNLIPVSNFFRFRICATEYRISMSYCQNTATTSWPPRKRAASQRVKNTFGSRALPRYPDERCGLCIPGTDILWVFNVRVRLRPVLVMRGHALGELGQQTTMIIMDDVRGIGCTCWRFRGGDGTGRFNDIIYLRV